MSAELSFVLSQSTRLTDRRTDLIAIRKIALHTMQRDNKNPATLLKHIAGMFKHTSQQAVDG